jgi:hypothetical protein
MEKSELVKKYKIKDKDWKNITLVEIKLKAQTVVALFIAIENTMASCISPVQSELIDNTKKELLTYLDENFIK